MTDALDKLIEAVEAGTAVTSSFHCEPFYSCTKGEFTSAVNAYYGSLDAALALHEALLPGWNWGRAPQGNMWVRSRGGKFVWSGDKPRNLIARAWLIAILRGYRTGQGGVDEPNQTED